jgi:PAS domain S-box-containing protein
MLGKYSNSLRVRLLLLVAVGTIPALCVIIYGYHSNRQFAESIFRQGAIRAAGQVSTYAPMVVEATHRLLSSLAADPAFKNLDIEMCREKLQRYLATDAGASYADLGLLDVNGDLICSGRTLGDKINFSAQQGFQQALAGGDFSIGVYRITQITSQTLVGFSYPILDSDGNLRAVLFAAMDPQWFDKLLDVSIMPSGSVITIIDARGTVLGRSSDQEQWVGQTITHVDIVQECLERRQGTVQARGVDGIPRYYGFKPLSPASPVGYVYAGIPVNAVGERAWNELYPRLIWLAIALGLSFAAIWAIGNHLVMRKAHVLLSVGRRLAEGDLSARTGFKESDGEIGGLGAALDQMADHVQNREAERDRALAELSKEQQLLNMIIESLPGTFYVFDPKGRMRMWNKVLETLTGRSGQEIASMNALDFFTDEDKKAVSNAVRRVLDVGETSVEASLAKPNGEKSTYYFTGKKIDIEGMSCVVGMGVDVTALKRAEQELQQSQRMLRDILATSPVGIALVKNRTIEWANEAWEEMFGYQRPAEYVGRKARILFSSEEDYDYIRPLLYRNVQMGSEASLDCKMKRVDGSTLDVHLRARQSHLSDAETDIVILAAADISNRKKAEEALRLEREQLLSIFDGIDQAISVIDPNTHEVLYVNRYLRDLYGKDPVGEICHWAFHNSSVRGSQPRSAVLDLRGAPQVWECDDPVLGKSFSVVDRAIRWPDGRTVKFTMAVDITDRKRAEQQLREVIESSPIGIAILRGGDLVFGNVALMKMFGCDPPNEITGISLGDYIAAEDRDKIVQQARDREAGRSVPAHYETRGRRSNGKTFDMAVWCTRIDYGGSPAVLAFLIDVSETKSLRAQLYQAQKMEALGTLAGGIAHDFNNLLTVVTGYGELLLASKKPGASEYEDLQKICAAGRRGAELVRGLLTLGRKAQSKPTPLNLNQSVEQTTKLLERTIAKMLEIEVILEPVLAMIHADPTQIDQILMNLAVNARDAMPRGGRLTLETKNVVLDKEYCRSQVEAREGPHVMLRVTDTGHGMDEETRERIFEPFFSTKEQGRGTGLGLAMVFGIVKQHGGHITCESQPGHGTTFRIYFPVCEGVPLQPAAADDLEPLMGTETILLVDDEEPVRNLGQRMLSPAGYTVLTATNGKEALDLYVLEKEDIDLVILDLIMPEMDGRTLCETLQKIDPDIKVLLTSGYGSPGTRQIADELGARGFVDKPYDVHVLLQAIRDALDKP